MSYDVIVIGSGPGGYVAAIRCAQLGMKTAIVERYPNLGGTCLNVGCIPSKALLDYSEHYHFAAHRFEQIGIHLCDLTVDLSKMIAQKTKVVTTTSKGIDFLMKKYKIDVHRGHGSFVDATHVAVTNDGTSTTLETQRVIIATGSKPSVLPGITIDKERVMTSTEALALHEIPKHLVVIGGGIIGVELGSVYARLGAKVSVVEYTDSLIPTMDRTMGKELQKSLKKLGFEMYLQHKVTGVVRQGTEVTVNALDSGGKATSITGDYCLVAVGRRPYTDGLGLENIGLTCDERGRIPVDAQLHTGVGNIYAIGDVIPGPMLAHKAEEEGVAVAERLAGEHPHINYRLIPSVVYTWPEVAGVGYTEEELKTEQRAFKTGTFPFMALGRARASGDIEGLVKVLADAQTDELLGVHICGPRAADLIGEAVVAMEFRASAEDIGRTCHAHPTFSEAFKEACLTASRGMALNA